MEKQFYQQILDDMIRIAKESGELFKNAHNDLRRMGSAGIDIALTASGTFAGFFETRLCPWDFACGILFMEESGGIITDFEGNKLQLNKKSSVLAGNERAYAELFKIINGN
ncbi:MAG: hypothetical protein IJX06_02040 [Clostridia bacterium]|nr:hypothetical protein [Clostridia bacterium]